MSPENQNHACSTIISRDKSENEMYANQAQWIFRLGDVILTCAAHFRALKLQKQPFLLCHT